MAKERADAKKNYKDVYTRWVRYAWNAYSNYGLFHERAQQGRLKKMGDPKKEGDLYQAGKGKSCIIIGTGPTLDDSGPLLASWKGDIICGNSNSDIVLAYGAKPSLVVCVDDGHYVLERITPDHPDYEHIPLACHTEVNPMLVYNYKGPIYPFLRYEIPKLTGEDHNEILYYAHSAYIMPEVYRASPLLHDYLHYKFVGFSSCLGMQLLIAQIMEYDTIFLVGVDFAFTYGRERAMGVHWDKTKWLFHDESRGWDKYDVIKGTHPLTSGVLVQSKVDFLVFWAQWFKGEIVECAEKEYGGLKILPKARTEDVIRMGGKWEEKMPHIERQDALNRYLKENKMFSIKFQESLEGVAHGDPTTNIS